MSHMRTVNLRELHMRTGAIVDLAARGETVTVVRRGVAIAELGPAKERRAPPLPDREKILARFPRVKRDSGRILEEDRS